MLFKNRLRNIGMSFLLLIGFILLTPGCGSAIEYADMTGSVTLDGKPVTAGSIYVVLHGKEDVTSGAPIKGDGTFVCKAPVGKVKVAVQTLSYKPGGANEATKQAPSTAPNKGGGKGPPAGYSTDGSSSKKGTVVPQAPAWASGSDAANPPKYVAIPGKYEKIETANLSYDITPGSNKIDIALSAK